MIKAERLFDYVSLQVKNHPNPRAISYKVDGNWQHYSSEQFQKEVNRYSLAFLEYGIQKGDKIGIIANNRPEWNFCDNGMMQIGAINIPIYPTSSLSDYEYILNNAEVKLLFVSDKAIFEKAQQAKLNVPSLKEIYSFDKIEGCPHVSEFLSQGNEDRMNEVESIQSTIKKEDLATIIYTSGTTGNPKGVMLSHKNIIFNVEEVSPHLPVTAHHRTLSFLPLCHIFERVVTYFYFSKGLEVYYAESIEKLKENIQEVQPNFLTCVPRLMEKIHEGILAKSEGLSFFSKIIYHRAMRLAHLENAKNNLFYPFFDRMVYRKIREALGGNILGIVTGAAALQPRIAIFFNNTGIPVREGYGMTETAPVISFNRFEEGLNKPGTVGIVLENVQIKFDHREGMESEDGEILVKGENVMMGYFKNQEATDATIKDGWLYTGDVGKIVDGKFLKITDRVKELFKTSGGKYVAPQFLENKLKESKYIEQVLVIGNDRRFVSALIVPTIANFKIWAGYKKLNLDFNSGEWVKNPTVQAKMKKEIDRYNIHFNHVEQIKKFSIVSAEWTIDSGELTPTLKPKRKVIEKKFSSLIEEMYID